MAHKVSGKTQLAIALAAMAATMTALHPAKSRTPHAEDPPAAGLFGTLKQPEPRTQRGFESF